MARPKTKMKTFEAKISKDTEVKISLTNKPLSGDFVVIKNGGLGDTVEAVLEKTGVKKIVEIFVDGKDCGCEERKQKLNELFPYRFKARCLTEQEYIDWSNFKEVRTLKLTWEQVVYVCDLYASVFSRQVWYPCSGCSPKPLISMIDKLDKVYDAYGS